MAKRNDLEKAEARKKRDCMLALAARAELSLTEGVREMRAISGLNLEEFARHRGVDAHTLSALEAGQANPTVVLLNQIGNFFGLEVAFVPKKHVSSCEEATESALFPCEENSAKGPGPTYLDAEIFQRMTKDSLVQAGLRCDAQTREIMEAFTQHSQKLDLLMERISQNIVKLEDVERISTRLDNLNTLADRIEALERLTGALNSSPELKEQLRNAGTKPLPTTAAGLSIPSTLAKRKTAT